MSTNTQNRHHLKMKPQPQANKKQTTINPSSVSNILKKNPQPASRTTTTSKDEEKTNQPSASTEASLMYSKRPTNRGTMQKVAAKPSVSRARDGSFSTTLRPKPHQFVAKQTQPSKNKQVSPKLKVNNITKSVPGKQNLVMNTVHNVTVSSPPSKRKEIPKKTIIEKEIPRIWNKSKKSVPEDVATLKDTIANSNVESKTRAAEAETQLPLKIREPVAFEVVFEESQKLISEDSFKNSKSQINSDEPDYDDDFESYESDFETGSSSELISESSSTSKLSSRDDRESPPDDSETDLDNKSDCEEESEVTHIPVTVIHREKEFERKLDSGNYDLNSKRGRPKEPFESFDTMPNSEQLDSGISYENNISTIPFDAESVTFGGFVQFYALPHITKRGTEIMSKIQFDMISFTLFDLKPIPYDIYMRMFGNSYTMQSATQTRDNCMESECQTDGDELITVWTQHPPQFSFVAGLDSDRISQFTDELNNDVTDEGLVKKNIFEKTVQYISKLKTSSSRMKGHHHKPINYERLNTFLASSTSIISRILSSNKQDTLLYNTDLPTQSKGFFKLNTKLLNALRVVRVFSNANFNLILTVHESIENVYHTDFSNLIMVWNCEDSAKPLRLLSTWSEVSRVEICNNSSDIIVCGLKDGSVAMWDMRETYSFCSKLDGHLTHFAATHSVAPSWGGADVRSFDSGAVVDVKSFRSTYQPFSSGNKLETIQFASLNEIGILVIWTLVETNAKNFEVSSISDSKFEYNSPWARVKLIQSAICDLREYVETGTKRPISAFEHTKTNFQKDVFNDDILKELLESQSDMRLGVQGLRFTNLDCGTEFVFVGTNRNFVISCSKTLKKERFRKINIYGSGFLFPTAIKLFPNEDFLAVGLSNGSVMILNCNQDKTYKKHLEKLSDNMRQTDSSQSKNEFDYEIGKSCAIQNIIQSERRSVLKNLVEDELRPNTAEYILATLEEGKKPYELRIFDEQVLLSGSVLRKDLIQNLQFSNDGWLLFALSDGFIRVYDFYTEKEVSFYGNTMSGKNIMDIAASRHGKENNIVLLDNNNDVQIHLLK